MFADSAKIYIRSGKGGDGHVSFRRELYVAAGGPDGGDGGRGGDVIFEVDEGLNTLNDFRHIRKYCAGDGEPGGKRRCHGADGKDIIIPENGKIPYLSPSELYRTSPMNSFVQALRRGEDGQTDGYIYADDGSTISAQQVAVTYRHKDRIAWNLPKVETAKFPKTMAKLNGGEKIKVLFYGDSITVGANSSEFIGYGPRAESYANMVKSYMQKRFPSATIDFKNNAVGGTDSNWGINKNLLLFFVQNPQLQFDVPRRGPTTNLFQGFLRNIL